VEIAQRREALDGSGKHGFGCQEHVDVDDRLCCQIGYGSAANVLNGRRHVTECIGDSFAKGLKESGPRTRLGSPGTKHMAREAASPDSQCSGWHFCIKEVRSEDIEYGRRDGATDARWVIFLP
jgi:hypothetical protein